MAMALEIARSHFSLCLALTQPCTGMGGALTDHFGPPYGCLLCPLHCPPLLLAATWHLPDISHHVQPFGATDISHLVSRRSPLSLWSSPGGKGTGMHRSSQ